jgi:hypothetical protein
MKRSGAFPLIRPSGTFSPTGEKAGMRGPLAS